ncbi:YeeE/YedE family protein [Pasteurellaceae bacterium USgator11]|nr:YeeE/YedE family protein [Pasteurellaceae bacterium UScroc12]TNG96531.1 YeeE/YedE family protein [Pasteurellaceae bacterium USgator41]TNH01349.1 YeeE/YedE family protein [Pasteurellaceae bacterium USgator11]TNH01444.1 YeeE/YedE family protein [Pasteurellaceae bacterium UScroc31]
MTLSGLFLGLIFGFVLQRGRFCLTSAFRDLPAAKIHPFLIVVLIAVSLQSIALFSLQSVGVLTLPSDSLPLLATLIGGLLFGVGMTFSGCCATGGWYRSGEGKINNWFTVLIFALTMAAAQGGVLRAWFRPLLADPPEYGNIDQTLNISPWILIALLVAVTALVSYRWLKNSTSLPKTTVKCGSNLFLLKPYRNPMLLGALLGVIGIAAWLLSAPTGRNFGLGISVPSANLIQYLVTGQSRYLNWGTYLVIGIPLGALLAVKLSGELCLRSPAPTQLAKSAVGGFLMGIGAALSGGCTIANTLVATAYFSWQGWLATLMMIIGVWLTSRFFSKPHCSA